MDDKPPPYSPSAPYLANAGPAYPSAYQAPYPPAVPPQSGVPYAPYPPPVGFVTPGGPNYMPHVPPQSGVCTQQPTAPPVTVVHFGRHPVLVTCPYCRNHGMTSVHPESGCLAWLLCALFCVFGRFAESPSF
ncbi:unnamed protein product [Dicrocoelium dendriticum]|nr:unnamed protein product [Dicrocoelium dendriticum]